MDNNNWRAAQAHHAQAQGQAQLPVQVNEVAPAGNGNAMEAGDWRTQLQPDSRQRIVIKIMETLKRHLPFAGEEGLQDMKKIAERFEEKIYTAAISQSDYLRKISLKMLTMETKSQAPMTNSGGNTSKNPSDSGGGSMQPQQGQPLSVPMIGNQVQGQGQGQMLSQGPGPGPSSGNGMGNASSLGNVSQNSNMQHMQNISNVAAQSSLVNPMGGGGGGQGMYAANTQQQQQRQLQQQQQQQQQGRQQQQVALPQQQQQQQQTQNPQQNYLFQQQQQMHHQAQLMKHKQLQQQQQQQGNIPQTMMQQQQQQQPQQQPMMQQQQQPQQQPMMQQQQQSAPLKNQQPLTQSIGQQSLRNQPIVSSQMMGQPQNQLMGQSNTSISDVQQQQRIMGQQQNIQMGNSSMTSNQQQLHMLPQPKAVPTPQGQQQQLMSQIQSQPPQLQQQQMGALQQQQQRIRQLNPSLHPPNILIDQQKQLFQSQRPEASSTSLDSTAQTGSSIHGGDWQEEGFQKIRSLKEMYFVELNNLYQKIAAKLQQHDSLPQQPKNDQIEKLKSFKAMLEKLLQFLQLNKNEFQPNHREKIVPWEKLIINILNSNRPHKPVPPMQQGLQSQMLVMSHENQMNPQMTNVQHNNLSMQQNSLSSASNISNPQQNVMNNMDSVQSIQQQQMNINSIAGASSHPLHSNINLLQQNSNMIHQQQHLKQQEQNMMQSHQLKQQLQHRQMQLHRQQILNQQTKHQQVQQPGQQLTQHQMSQIHQLPDSTDLKMRQQQQQMNLKTGNLNQNQNQQHQLSNQRSAYQMKPGTQFPISSPQILTGQGSPQIPQHSSPQIDLTSFTKNGTSLQNSGSPFIIPSPSTPLAPSPMPMESEKVNPGASSLSNAPNTGQHISSAPAQSLAIGTPGISASPLLAEFTSPDGTTHGISSTITATKTNTVEQPHERLMKAVKSISAKALSASVSDISSVVSMVDRIAGSAPGNGSRAAVGEDLVAMTKCRLQARNFFTQDGPSGSKKMRRYTSATLSNVVSSGGSVNDSFRQLNGFETSDLESTATSGVKRSRLLANHALNEEIREINQRLIDTVVSISSDEDADQNAVAGSNEGGEGTIVKCSFSAVALCPNLKAQYNSAQMSQIQPLRLFVPINYPNCCPIFLDKFPVEVSKEYEDLSVKAKSKFSISLRSLSQPMSLSDIAKTWDVCSRAVISEYAQQSGGGTFTSKYGTWETIMTA